jgi:hypothetical protein
MVAPQDGGEVTADLIDFTITDVGVEDLLQDGLLFAP